MGPHPPLPLCLLPAFSAQNSQSICVFQSTLYCLTLPWYTRFPLPGTPFPACLPTQIVLSLCNPSQNSSSSVKPDFLGSLSRTPLHSRATPLQERSFIVIDKNCIFSFFCHQHLAHRKCPKCMPTVRVAFIWILHVYTFSFTYTYTHTAIIPCISRAVSFS